MFKKLSIACYFILCFSSLLLAKLPIELPPTVYAVPGIETNIYFDNIVLTTNARNYVFDVTCSKGRNDAKRWCFIPSDKDVGSYTWKVRVFNEKNKLVAAGTTKIIVSPKNSGAGKKIFLLLIGDSLTDQHVYPTAIYDLMTKQDNLKLTMIGSHSGRGRESGKIAHEGYGGWTWKRFCTHWTNGKDYRAKSKFLTLANGKPKLDFKAYINKYGNGKNPDFITIMLGTNDIYSCNDSNITQRIQVLVSYADKFIYAIKKDAPNAQIGLVLTVPPAASQDAFGNNGKCAQTCWQFRRNQFHLVKVMIKKFGNGKVKNVSLIPVFVGLDCENNFPMASKKLNSRNTRKVLQHYNAVHPAKSGYLQIADSFYCWLKYKLNK
jgi:lysophospholipase L1-like esterase